MDKTARLRKGGENTTRKVNNQEGGGPIPVINGVSITGDMSRPTVSIDFTPADAVVGKTRSGNLFSLSVSSLGGSGGSASGLGSIASPVTIDPTLYSFSPGTRYLVTLSPKYTDNTTGTASIPFTFWIPPSAPTGVALTTPQPNPNNNTVVSINFTPPNFGLTVAPVRPQATPTGATATALVINAATGMNTIVVVYSAILTPASGSASTQYHSGSSNTMQLTGLIPGVQYTIAMKTELYSYSGSTTNGSLRITSSVTSSTITYSPNISPPTAVRLVPINSTSATLAWSAPTLPSGINITSYTYTLTGSSTATGTLSSITSPQTITGLQAGAFYTGLTLQPVGTAGKTFLPYIFSGLFSGGTAYRPTSATVANPQTFPVVPSQVTIGTYAICSTFSSSSSRIGYASTGGFIASVTSVTATSIGYTNLFNQAIGATTTNPNYTFYALIMPPGPPTIVGYTATSNRVTYVLTAPASTQSLSFLVNVLGSTFTHQINGLTISPINYAYTLTPVSGGTPITATWALTSSVTSSVSVNSLISGSANMNVASPTSLSAGTRYNLSVTGLLGTDATTRLGNTSPATMQVSTILSAPGTLAVTSSAATSIGISFIPPTTGAGVTITGYNFSTIPARTGQVTDVTLPAGTSGTISGLTPGTNYTSLTISAVTAGGAGTATTPIAFITAPNPPTNLEVKYTQNSATLSWTPPTAAATSPAPLNATAPYRYMAVSSTGAPTLTGNMPLTILSTPSNPITAAFHGYISGNQLSVISMSSMVPGGLITVTGRINTPGVSANTVITAFGSGSGGGGTYTLSNSQTFGSPSAPVVMTLGGVLGGLIPSIAFVGHISGTTLTVSKVIYGKLEVGTLINGSGVSANTSITALGTGTGFAGTYTINNTQTIASATTPISMTSGFLPGNTYTITATANNSTATSGGESAPSNAVTITMLPAVPQNIAVLSTEAPTSTSATLTWSFVNGAKLPDSYAFTSPTLGTLTPSETNYTTAPFTAKFTNLPGGTSTPIAITTRNNAWQAASVATAPTLQTSAPANITSCSITAIDNTNTVLSATTYTGTIMTDMYLPTTMGGRITQPTSANEFIVDIPQTLVSNSSMILYSYILILPPSQPTMSLITSESTNSALTATYSFSGGNGATHYAFYMDPPITAVTSTTPILPYVSYIGTTVAGSPNITLTAWRSCPIPLEGIQVGMYVFGLGILPDTQVTARSGSGLTISNAATQTNTRVGIFTFSIFPTIRSPVTFGKLTAGQNVKFGMFAINSTAPMGIDSGWTPTYAVPATANFTRKHVQSIAGSGAAAYMDGSLVASLNSPRGLAIHANGDIYVADRGNNRIRKITNSGSGVMVGTVTIIAGTGVAGSANGPGLSATFNQPSYLALNAAGTILYVCDAGTNIIRKVDMTTSANTVTTVTPGTNPFTTPQGICVDSNGVIYVVDSGRHRIVRLNSSGGLVTVAGTAGTAGSTDGPLATARFNTPIGLAINAAGNTLYVADTSNHRVRVIRFTPLPVDSTEQYVGTVSTLAGGSTISATGFGTASGFANSGDSNSFGVAGLNSPTGITVDSVGNIYVTDNGNSRIRKITPGGYVSIVGGFNKNNISETLTGYINGDPFDTSKFSDPKDIKVDANGNLYVADAGNHRIRKIADIVAPTPMTPVPTPYYMNPTSVLLGWTGGTVPGISYSYNINGGADIVSTSIVSPLMVRNLTADTAYTIVLRGTTTSSMTATWSFRTPAASTVLSYYISTVAGGGSTGSADGIEYEATFNAPRGCVYDHLGNLYIADTANHTIRMVAGNTVTTIAGTAGTAGATDGIGAAARFSSPIGLAIEDNARILYVADSENHKIRKIVITTSGATLQATVSTIAGSTSGNTDNPNALQAQLKSPAGIFVGRNNVLYIGDTGNNRVRILKNQGLTTLIDISGGFGDLSSPTDVVEDAAGNIYISNSGNNKIVKFNIALEAGVLAGSTSGFSDESGKLAKFNIPYTMVPDPFGNLIIADRTNNRIRRLSPLGQPMTIVGNGTQGWADGIGTASGTMLNNAAGIGINPIDNSIAVTDTGNNRIRIMTPLISPPTPTGITLGFVNDRSAMIYWTESTIQGVTHTYTITPALTHNNNPIMTSSPVTFTELTPSTAYTITITATNTAGSSAPASFSFSTLAVYSSSVTFNPTTMAPYIPGRYVSTFAGLVGTAARIDAIGLAARFNNPQHIATDANGTMYIADTNNNCIRMMTTAGVVTTLAGTGTAGSTEGAVSAATFNRPVGIAVNSAGTIVYVSDTGNHKIRRIAYTTNSATGVSSWMVSTLAGTGTAAVATLANDSPASFSSPQGICLDSAGNIIVADTGLHRIRRVTPAGVVTTIGGWSLGAGVDNGSGAAVLFNGPRGVCADAFGNIYVADTGNNCIRRINSNGKITRFAGRNTESSHIDGAGNMASFKNPCNIIYDNATRFMYVIDAFSSISRLTLSGSATTIAGTPTGAASAVVGHVDNTIGQIAGSSSQTTQFRNPIGLAVDSNGNMYVTDSDNHLIRLMVPVALPTAPVLNVVRNEGNAITVDWTGGGLVSEGIQYTYRCTNNGARVGITPTGKMKPVTFLLLDRPAPAEYQITVTAINGMLPAGVPSAPMNVTTPAYIPTTVGTYAGAAGTTGTTEGRIADARFNNPFGVALDTYNNIFIADTTNNKIRMITNTGVVTTIAGTGTASYLDGAGGVATFNRPHGIAVNAAGNIVYVPDTVNNRIRIIRGSGSSWTVSTLAGSGAASVSTASADGVGTAATFKGPRGIITNATGTNIYVADTGNHQIRRISLRGGGLGASGASGAAGPLVATVTTIAGVFQGSGYVNGPAATAKFNEPWGIAVTPDERTIYVADTKNNCIRVIRDGFVSDLLNANTGLPVVVNEPAGMCLDTAGNLFIADTKNHRIIRVNPFGGVTSIAGPTGGFAGSANGTPNTASGRGVDSATFNYPTGIAVTGGGTIFIADTNNHTIRRITIEAPPTAPVPTQSNLTSTSVRFTWPDVAQPMVGSRPVTYSYTMPPHINDIVNNVTSPLEITNLLPGTGYTLNLSAIDDGGAANSPPIIFSTLPPPPLPVGPALLYATPNSFAISWPTTGPQSGQFAISFRYTLDGTAIICNSQDSNMAVFTSITPGAHTIMVTAVNLSGSTDGPSLSVMLPPSQPTLTVTTTTTNSITVGWTGGVGATSYTYSITPSTGVLPTTQTSPAVFSGLSSGVSYTIRLTATNSGGSTTSATIQATTVTILPSNFEATSPRIVNTVITSGLTSGAPTPHNNRLLSSSDGTIVYSIDNTTANTQQVRKFTVATNTMAPWLSTNASLNPRDFMNNVRHMATDSVGNIYFTTTSPHSGTVLKWRAADNTFVVIAGGPSLSSVFNNMIRDGFTINTTYSLTGSGSWPAPFSNQQMNTIQIVGTITLNAQNRYILDVTRIIGGNMYRWDPAQNANTNKTVNVIDPLDSSTPARRPIIYPGMAVGLSARAEIVNGVTIPATPAFSSFSGSISGSNLTVSSIAFGSLTLGTVIGGPNIPVGTRITAFGANTNGGPGTYTLSQNATVSSVPTCVFSGYFTSASSIVTLVVTSVLSGTLSVGMWVSGFGVCPGAYISALGAGTTGAVGTYTVIMPRDYLDRPGLYGPSTNTLNTATSTATALLGTITSPVSLFGTTLAGFSYIQMNDTIPCVVPGANPLQITDNQNKWGIVITDFLTGNGGVGTYLVSNVSPGTPLYNLTESTTPTLAVTRANNSAGLGTNGFSVPTALTCAGFICGNQNNNTRPQVGNAVTNPTSIAVDPTGNAVYVVENGGGGNMYANNTSLSLRKFVRMQGINPADEIWRSYTLTATGTYNRDTYGVMVNPPGSPLNPSVNTKTLLSPTAAWGQGFANTFNSFLFGEYQNASPPVIPGGSLNFQSGVTARNFITPQNTITFVGTLNGAPRVNNIYGLGTGAAGDAVHLAVDPTDPNKLYLFERTNCRVLLLTQRADNTLTVALFAGDIGRTGFVRTASNSISQTLDTKNIWYDGPGLTVASFGQIGAATIDKFGYMYLADNDNKCVRMISPAGIVSTIAGGNGVANLSNALTTMDAKNPPPPGQVGTTAGFNSILAITVDSSRNLYVSDTMGSGGPNKIRKISAFAAPPVITYSPPITPPNINNNYIITTAISNTVNVTHGTPPTSRAINPIAGTTFIDAAGNIYFSNTGSFCIFKIGAPTGTSTVYSAPVLIAGTGSNVISYETGLATECALGFVTQIIGDDAGNLYIIDTPNPQTRGTNDTVNIGSINKSSIRKLSQTATANQYILSNILLWPRLGFVGITINRSGNILAMCLATTIIDVLTMEGIYEKGIYQIPLDGSMITEANIIPITGPLENGNYLTKIVCDRNTDVIYCAYVGSTNRIYKLTPTIINGRPSYSSSLFTQYIFDNITSLCIDRSGMLYFIDSVKYSSTGKPAGTPGLLFVVKPTGVLQTTVQLNVITNQISGNVTDGLGGQVGSIIDATMGPTGQFMFLDYITRPGSTESRFRQMNFVSYEVYTSMGSGYGYFNSVNSFRSSFRNPSAIIFDSNKNAYIVDQNNHCIRKYTVSTRAITLFAGTPGRSGYMDGAINVAKFNRPTGIAIDTAGFLYVTDTANHCIRRIDTIGNVITFAGHPDVAYFNPPTGCSISGTTLTIPNSATPVIANRASQTSRGWVFGVPVADKTVNGLVVQGMIVNGPGVTAGTRIIEGPINVTAATVQYKVNISQNVISATGFTFTGATPTAGYINQAWDATNTYTSVITHTTTYNADRAHPAVKFNMPTGITCDAGLSDNRAAINTLYIADTGNNCIRSISIQNAATTTTDVTTLAGPPMTHPSFSTMRFSAVGATGAADRGATGVVYDEARFNSPRDLAPLWYSFASGQQRAILFVCDTGNNCIRAIVPSSSSRVFTILGDGNRSARLTNTNIMPTSFTPAAIESDANGNIYFSDLNTHTIYSYTSGVSVATPTPYVPVFGRGVVGFVAGSPTTPPFYTDGDNAAFNLPMGFSLHNPITKEPPLFVCDFGNNRIRHIKFKRGTVPAIQAGLGTLYFPCQRDTMNNPLPINLQTGIIDLSLAPGTKKFYDVSNCVYIMYSPDSGGVVSRPSIMQTVATIDSWAIARRNADKAVADEKLRASAATASSAVAQTVSAAVASAATASSAVVQRALASVASAATASSAVEQMASASVASAATASSADIQLASAATASSAVEQMASASVASAATASSADIQLASAALVEQTASSASLQAPSQEQTSSQAETSSQAQASQAQSGGGPPITSLPIPKSLNVTTLLGSTETGLINGVGTSAKFITPYAAISNTAGDTIYISDLGNNRIRKAVKTMSASTATWTVSTLVTIPPPPTGSSYSCTGMCLNIAQTLLYIVDTGNNCIRSVNTSGTGLSVFAGVSGTAGYRDDAKVQALFNMPFDIVINTSGIMFVADYGNHCIRRIDIAGNVTTYAGNYRNLVPVGATNPNSFPYPPPGATDGEEHYASFNGPIGLTIDTNNNLYVADYENNCIRKIGADNIVVTVAGDLNGKVAGLRDGVGSNARFNHPVSCCYFNNILYVCDEGGAIRALSSVTLNTPGYSNVMSVTTVAGNGQVVGAADNSILPIDGHGPMTGFNSPSYISVLGNSGSLLIADFGNSSIRSASQSSLSIVSCLPDIPVMSTADEYQNTQYSKWYEVTARRYLYVANDCNEFSTPASMPLDANNNPIGTKQAPNEGYTDNLNPGKIWEKWKNTVATSTTFNAIYYYSPQTGEVVWNLPLEAYPLGKTLTFTGTISGYTLTVSNIPSSSTSARIQIGSIIYGQNVPANTIVSGFISGSGHVGTYTIYYQAVEASSVNIASQTMSSSAPIYPPSYDPVADETLPETCFWLKYQAPAAATARPVYYMNLVTTEFSYDAPTCTELVAYPEPQTLDAYRMASSAVAQQASHAQASSALAQEASSAMASSAVASSAVASSAVAQVASQAQASSALAQQASHAQASSAVASSAVASSAVAQVASQAQASSALGQQASHAQASSALAQYTSQARASSALAQQASHAEASSAVASSAVASSAVAQEASQAVASSAVASSAVAQQASQAMASSAVASSAVAQEASQAMASSATAQEASRAQASSAVASSAVASSAVAQQASQAVASSATAQEASRAQASSAVAQQASQAQASSAMAQVASQARASQATASAAQYSGAVQQYSTSILSQDIATSAEAAHNLTLLVLAQIPTLKAMGAYDSASTLIINTLRQIRASVAYLNNHPTTITDVAELNAALIDLRETNPSTASSAVQASAALLTVTNNLQSTDRQIAIEAARQLTRTTISQANYLLAIGQYSSASSLIRNTIQQLNALNLRFSTGGAQSGSEGGTPEVMGFIEELNTLLELIDSIDPRIIEETASRARAQASSAVAQQASSAVAQQASSAVAQAASSAMAQEASQAMASSATAQEASQAMASSAVASSATAQQASQAMASSALASQAQASSATAQEASQAIASSATAQQASQAMASSALASQAQASWATAQEASQAMASSATAQQASQAQASSALAQEASQAMASSATAQQASQAMASSATAEQVASQARASSAIAQEASQAMASSATAQEASQAMASQATASAAEFSGAIQSLVAALANTDIAQSALAVQNLVNLVIPQVQALKDAGSYQEALGLLVQTLDDIRQSVAFLNNDPSTIDIVSNLTTTALTIYNLLDSSSNASGASGAANPDIINLNDTDIDISTTAAFNLTESVKNKANFLLAIGLYSQAETLLSETIQLLNNSTAADTPTVQGYIGELQELLDMIEYIDPAKISQRENALQAVASSAVAQEASQAQASQAQASSAVAQEASQAQASSAVAQGASHAQASSAMAQVASQARASQATASAAQYSGAVQQYTTSILSQDIATSAEAAHNLTLLVLAQIPTLKAMGAYESATTLIVNTLGQIRASVAYLNNNPTTITDLADLNAALIDLHETNPSTASSAVQASAAVLTITNNLQSNDRQIAIEAARQLTRATVSQANYLLAIGQYSSASSLVRNTIQQLNALNLRFSTGGGSTGGGPSGSGPSDSGPSDSGLMTNEVSLVATDSGPVTDEESLVATDSGPVTDEVSLVATNSGQSGSQGGLPEIQEFIDELNALLQLIESIDPRIIEETASRARAQASSAVAQQASQAQASAAQIYYTNALQGNDIQLALTAAASLVSSVTSTVNSLVSSGSYYAALTLITEALQQLMASNAYSSNNEQMIAYVQQLNTLAQSVVQGNPGAQASSAQASAAQSYYVSALQGSEAASVTAAKNLVEHIQTTVQLLVTIGSFSAALTLISETISQIQSSTAFTAGNAEVIALVGTLNTLATTVSAQNPARATGASAALATGPSATGASAAATAPAAPSAAATPAPAPPAPAPAAIDPAVLAALMTQLQQKPLVAATPTPGSSASAAQAAATQLVTSLQNAITSMNNVQKQLEAQNAIIKNPASSPTDKQAAQAAVAKLTTELATYRSQVVSYVLQLRKLQPGLISAETISSLLEASGYGEGYGYGYGYGYGNPVSGGSRKKKSRKTKSKKSRRGRK